MNKMVVLAVAAIGIAAGIAKESQAIGTTMTREEIRAKEITERPNRVGHFYGNTVRRRHHRAGD